MRKGDSKLLFCWFKCCCRRKMIVEEKERLAANDESPSFDLVKVSFQYLIAVYKPSCLFSPSICLSSVALSLSFLFYTSDFQIWNSSPGLVIVVLHLRKWSYLLRPWSGVWDVSSQASSMKCKCTLKFGKLWPVLLGVFVLVDQVPTFLCTLETLACTCSFIWIHWNEQTILPSLTQPRSGSHVTISTLCLLDCAPVCFRFLSPHCRRPAWWKGSRHAVTCWPVFPW